MKALYRLLGQLQALDLFRSRKQDVEKGASISTVFDVPIKHPRARLAERRPISCARPHKLDPFKWTKTSCAARSCTSGTLP